MQATPQPNVASSTQFTIGKIDAGLAILLSPDNYVVEFPSSILPTNVTVGSIVNVKIESNMQAEQRERQEFDNLQLEIYENYIQTPLEPVLSIIRVGQTDALIGWKPLDYKASTLIRLDLYKNQVLFKKCENTGRFKVTGLDMNATYQFHLVMVTTAGSYKSNTIDVKTKTLEDLTSLYPSFGTFSNEADIDALQELLERMGATWSDDLTSENTHLVCSVPRGPKYERAVELNIPIVSPEFLKSCHSLKKIQAAHTFLIK